MYKHIGILPAKPFARVLPTHYRKHKVIVILTDTVSLDGLNWSGGSRSSYWALTLDGLRITGNTDRYHMMSPWNNPAEGARLPILPGFVALRGGTFCGKPSVITVHINPHDTRHVNLKDAWHLLPEPPQDEPAPYVAHTDLLPSPRGWDSVEGGARLA